MPPSDQSTEEPPGYDWRTLTADPRKWSLLAVDEWFLGGIRHAAPFIAAVQGHALLVIQPDCVAAGLARPCFDFVRAHGFEPVHHTRFRLDHRVAAAVWHYQSAISTQDCLDVADAICDYADAVLVVLRDTTPVEHLPASLRLTYLKGPARPERREPGQLRQVLGSPNCLVAYVHASDEPIDVIRESYLMAGEEVPSMYAAMTAPIDPSVSASLYAELEAMTAATERSDMNPAAALNRLMAQTPPGHPATCALQATRDTGAHIDWARLREHLADLGIDPHSWDPLLVASHHIVYDLPAAERRINRPPIDSWSPDSV
ncbi:nucleoside-diphosphate kinase [Actinokineospora diospyrosa]|uniref:Nucleoside diphosphate kinase n=1 Tax=Actinokineospora diospyrosa TaxID=103728 RepID=A0ABT1IE75_9PSEU|nr:nucleoside-diphosphate kinase [Actinokineospora diospyrosa]MCP2270888.1 nucleoside diphosphate kinase [Actinokineospora diospyrosa]